MFGHKYSANEAVAQSMLSRRSEGILFDHGCSMSSKVAKWTEARRQDAAQFIHRNGSHVGAETAAQQRRALESVLECIYSELKRYQFHFNGVAVGSDLYVVDSLLAQVKEPIQTNKLGEVESSVTYMRMRFSTATLSLVVRGRLDLIECFLVPTSHVMSLSKIEDQFAPLLTVQVKTIDGQFCWRAIDAGGSINDIEEFTMWLFDQLIDRSKESIAPQLYPQQMMVSPTGPANRGCIFEERGYISRDEQPELLGDVLGARDVPVERPLFAHPIEHNENPTEHPQYSPHYWAELGCLPQQQQPPSGAQNAVPMLPQTQPGGLGAVLPLQAPSFTMVCAGGCHEKFDYRKAWG